MNWKRGIFTAGVVAGVFLGMKYVLPVMLPFFFGWILAETVYPLSARLAEKKICRSLHITESGIGTLIILILTLAGMALILMGADYLTGKIGACIKYYPIAVRQAKDVIHQCCIGAEHITGIPAGESSNYVYAQMEQLGQYFWKDGKGMNTAVGSMKGCIVIVSMLIVGIVSSILFLQEREQIKRFLENRRFYVKIRNLFFEIAKGAKAYIKSQVKIMLIVCAVCVGGFWVLGSRYFLGYGLAIGILDAFPILGTGTFLIPGGIILFLQGKSFQGTGFLILYLVTAAIRQFLEPRLIGAHVGVSPLLVLVSVYVGVIVYGGFGFILGPLSGLLLYGIFKEWDFKKIL